MCASGLRAKEFDRKKIKLAWLLVHVQTAIALGLVVSSSVLIVTFGTTTQGQCYSAIMVSGEVFFLVVGVD